MRHVAIMIFDDIEVLDFAGPYEVFNVTGELNKPSPLNVFTVAESNSPVRTRGQLSVNPNYSIYNMPKADILLIPGGAGCRALLTKPHILEWVQEQAEQVEHLLSVCTGSLVLAKAGLLDGLEVTTHHDNLDDLEMLVDDTATIIRDKRYVDTGKIVMSGGVSAGIDMSLYIIQKLFGNQVLAKTLTEMEYPYTGATDLVWKETLKALD
ncbi:MAG: DJ-1/PfpI family protein [Phototrophicaceae bacterium]